MTTLEEAQEHLKKGAERKVGEWLLNAHANQLVRGGEAKELEYRLTNLLIFLLENRDRVLTKEEILKAVWPKKVVNDDSVAVAISQLRKALDDTPRKPSYIKTIPGVGYQYIYPEATGIGVEDSFNHSVKALSEERSYSWRIAASLVAVMATIAVGISHWKSSAVLEAPVEASTKSSVAHQTGGLLEQAEELTKSKQDSDWREAVKLLRQFLTDNPNSGKAYLSLAEAKIKLLGEDYARTENYNELHALLTKALSLEPQLARAHSWLGELHFVHDLKPAEAERHFKLAVALAPQDDSIRYKYAHFLYIYRRFSEAREQINISRGINPLSYASTSMVWTYLLQGENELALNELNRIQSTEDTDRYFKVAAQNVYFQLGDEQRAYESMQWFFDRAQLGEEKISALNNAFAKGGMKEVYRWLLDHKEMADLGQYTPPISWARYAIAIGDKKAAMNYLEQAFIARQPHVECAVSDPRYAPLKDEIRFKEFVARFGGISSN